MPIVPKGSRVEVATRKGKTLAGVMDSLDAEHLGGKRRRALEALHLFKRDHPNGGSVDWYLPTGTEFNLLSGPKKER